MKLRKIPYFSISKSKQFLNFIRKFQNTIKKSKSILKSLLALCIIQILLTTFFQIGKLFSFGEEMTNKYILIKDSILRKKSDSNSVHSDELNSSKNNISRIN